MSRDLTRPSAKRNDFRMCLSVKVGSCSHEEMDFVYSPARSVKCPLFSLLRRESFIEPWRRCRSLAEFRPSSRRAATCHSPDKAAYRYRASFSSRSSDINSFWCVYFFQIFEIQSACSSLLRFGRASMVAHFFVFYLLKSQYNKIVFL